MDIKIGTSGYSFDDWKGTFYPTDIQKGKMFDYYIQHFRTVEINSTYYHIPHPAVMANIEKKSPADFEFIVKTPDILTHKRKNIEPAVKAFDECLKPMIEAGKLKGILAQFPYSFKFNQANLDYLKYCRELLEKHNLFVEFRHNSWVNRTMYDNLKSDRIGYVAVDEPPLSGLLAPDLFNTTETAYIRLHGRNSEHWWRGGSLRYDYDYTKEELEQWKEKIKKREDKFKKLYIFFNNCHLGQAVKNAREMMQMLEV
ncbi:MAG: DUF72 domain-containing protein [candidate division Zixibacteria bacterium HGW-Zixibacteria-1]|nr:MAG: DUF72 domain-containing protein [candidate division Zixibacteria bacterium HGW-Zixibacteria-1]